MKNSRIYILLLFALCSVCSISQNEAIIADVTDHVSIKNLHKVDDGIYRSSQPDQEQFEALEKHGIKEVLNLRRHHSDVEIAQTTNLTLHRIAVRASVLNESHLMEALKIIKERKGNILIHCHHGSDRTGAVIAVYRIIFQGWSKEEAIDELTNGGYGFHSVYINIPQLIKKIDVNKFRKELFGE